MQVSSLMLGNSIRFTVFNVKRLSKFGAREFFTVSIEQYLVLGFTSPMAYRVLVVIKHNQFILFLLRCFPTRYLKSHPSRVQESKTYCFRCGRKIKKQLDSGHLKFHALHSALSW